MLRSLFRVIKFGFMNFWRNIWMSFATTLIMVLTLFSISLLIILNLYGDLIIENIKNKIDVTVFFQQDVSKAQIDEVQSALSNMTDVDEVKYTSKDEALKEFQSKHGDNPLILSSITELEGNPLRDTLVIRAKNLDKYNDIKIFLDNEKYQPIVEKFTFDDNKEIINKVSSTLSIAKKIGIGVSVIFCIIVVLVMFNTIRMTIYTQKDEISIMRLVGATNAFIEIPFIIEGMLYGLFASVISTLILYPIILYTTPKINEFFQLVNVDAASVINKNLLIIIAVQLLLGIFLGVVSSAIAIRKYLKV
ncbi:MAG: permease-like cell division protein FtsX [Patescibacteria group bacterium]|nr:permease-like cell division protein FtsX [Patescibacteria group bacterium]